MHLSIIDNRNSSGKFSHIVSKHFMTSNLEHGPGGSGGLSNGSFGFLSRSGSKLDRLVERPASTLALAALACLAFNRRRCLSACKASECVHFTRQNRFSEPLSAAEKEALAARKRTASRPPLLAATARRPALPFTPAPLLAAGRRRRTTARLVIGPSARQGTQGTGRLEP